ncbi:hypothetical protein [Haloarcula marina]|uniref:hypothetical protein n=1 Tax=Haloarcula marina TaxID=2961574 RepID=UPI0020B8E36F|nr:hypothetical protein [Halomicroarcula marina]
MTIILVLGLTLAGTGVAAAAPNGPPCEFPGEGNDNAQSNYDENTDTARDNRGTSGECDDGFPGGGAG